MNLKQIKLKLLAIKARGFIVTKRAGNTGVGHTLEKLLGLKENNIKLPDFGKIELKSKRSSTSSLVTLFTFNRSVWKVHPSDVIKKYGYRDTQKRKALKCEVSVRPNPQGLSLTVSKHGVQLRDANGKPLASWKADSLMQYFSQKLPALVLVSADTRVGSGGREEFRYAKAEFLTKPSKRGLLRLIAQGHVVMNLRMHLTPAGQVRNRGTAFRIAEADLAKCFAKRTNVL